MRTPEGSYRPPKGMGRVYLWFMVIGSAIFGGFLFVISVAMPFLADPAWSVSTAVIVAALSAGWVGVGSFGWYRVYLRPEPMDGRRVATTDVDGAPALVLTWRTTFLRFSLAGQAFVAFIGAAFAYGGLRDGHGIGWLGLVLAVPIALTLPDKSLSASRAARLVLTPKGIGTRGWGGDSWLDWDDVADIDLVDAAQHTVLRVIGASNAPSWRWRRRRRFLYAGRPKGHFIDIPGPALDVNAYTLADAVMFYARNEGFRAELAGDAGRRRIVEQVRAAL